MNEHELRDENKRLRHEIARHRVAMGLPVLKEDRDFMDEVRAMRQLCSMAIAAYEQKAALNSPGPHSSVAESLATEAEAEFWGTIKTVSDLMRARIPVQRWREP